MSFYFILENSTTGKRCGTVRIYNFNDDVFEWGSWILDGNKSRYAAMKTAILIYEFAFNVLDFDRSEFKGNKRNEKVISYHKKSGAKIIRQDEYNFISLYRRKLVYNFLILLEKNSNQNFHDYGEVLADETTFRKRQVATFKISYFLLRPYLIQKA